MLRWALSSIFLTESLSGRLGSEKIRLKCIGQYPQCKRGARASMRKQDYYLERDCWSFSRSVIFCNIFFSLSFPFALSDVYDPSRSQKANAHLSKSEGNPAILSVAFREAASDRPQKERQRTFERKVSSVLDFASRSYIVKTHWCGSVVHMHVHGVRLGQSAPSIYTHTERTPRSAAFGLIMIALRAPPMRASPQLTILTFAWTSAMGVSPMSCMLCLFSDRFLPFRASSPDSAHLCWIAL